MKLTSLRLEFVLIVGLLAGAAAVPSAKALRAADVLDPAAVTLQQIASGLSQPVFVTNAGDGSGRLFIVEQTGTIRILRHGVLLATPFLDVHAAIRFGGEQGLLALAFHPSYTSNGFFYIAYTAPRSGDNGGSVLTLKRFKVSANPDVADPNSGSVVLTVDHPTNSNHNGGTLAFGPDGYLYWSTGDGGSGGDPPNNAQTLTVLLGKILRLDVDSASPYSIPPGNPFAGDTNAAKRLIWAYGLRNPWRMSFDRLSHDLYIGDVGQGAWEEIDFRAAGTAGGDNYGWHVREGNACYQPSSGCSDPPNYVPPVAIYDHSGARCAVTGGYVYRGSLYPALQGYYLYGDYCSGAMYALRNSGAAWDVTTLPDTPYNISSFGEDEGGELYVADLGGRIFHIAAGAVPPTAQPADGSTVCLQSDVGVDLPVTAVMRQPDGSFTPSNMTLTLDGGADVTTSPDTTIAEAMVSPSSHVTIRYKPPSDLTEGSHQVEFTYPMAGGGTDTLQWSFTASGACPSAPAAPAADQQSIGAAPVPSQAPAATSEPASAAVTAETSASTEPAIVAPVVQPTAAATEQASAAPVIQAAAASASSARGHQDDTYIRRVGRPR